MGIFGAVLLGMLGLSMIWLSLSLVACDLCANNNLLDQLQTGPTSSMVSNYVTAAILSAANLLGHQAGSDKPCPRHGTNINCLVKFGEGEIDYNSYT